MGLANKIKSSQGGAGAPPPVPSAPPPQSSYSQPPNPYGNPPPIPQKQYGGYPEQQKAQAPSQYGYQQPQQQQPYQQQQYGGYGQPQQQQYGGYNQPPQQYGGYGQPSQQQPASYGQAPPVPAQQQRQSGPPQPQYQQYGQTAQNQMQNYINLLTKAVAENRLHAFYDNQKIQQIASTIGSKVDYISQTWNIQKELANDLVRLALYDIVIFADDSGSMSFEENGERIEDLKLIINRTAFISAMFDDDGIQVRFMNSDIKGDGLKDERGVLNLISQVHFRGLTPLGTSLYQKVIEPMVLRPAKYNQLRKPVLVIVITDGQPAGEPPNTVTNVIIQAKEELSRTAYGPGSIAFQFAQVGNDIKARDFLAELDTHPKVGKMIDCTSNFEVEQDEMLKKGVNLDPQTWLVKMLLGAIDPSYDEKDE